MMNINTDNYPLFPYSSIDLTSKKSILLRQLRDAFLGCSCIFKNDRKILIYQELIQTYNRISVNNSHDKDWMQKLIVECQNYEGALELLIDIVKDREGESKQMRDLETTVASIFDPCPEIYFLTNQGQSWIIRIENNEEINIPTRFDEPNINIQQERERLVIWKQIHTLCEQLAKDYLSIYKFFHQKPNEDTIGNLREFQGKSRTFVKNLNEKIGQTSFNFEPITDLAHIESCIAALIHVMEFAQKYPTCSYHKTGIKFGEFIINDLLFGSLRIADRILQEHFDNQAS